MQEGLAEAKGSFGKKLWLPVHCAVCGVYNPFACVFSSLLWFPSRAPMKKAKLSKCVWLVILFLFDFCSAHFSPSPHVSLL